MKFAFGRLSIRPNEFWDLRPKDLFMMMQAYNENEKQKEEFHIRMTRELIASIINFSFNAPKQSVSAAEIWPLDSDPKPDIPAVQEYTLQELQNIESLLANL